MSNDKLTPEEMYILFLEINRILFLEVFAEALEGDSSELGGEVAVRASEIIKSNSSAKHRELFDEMKTSFVELIYPKIVDRSYSSSNNSD